MGDGEEGITCNRIDGNDHRVASCRWFRRHSVIHLIATSRCYPRTNITMRFLSLIIVQAFVSSLVAAQSPFSKQMDSQIIIDGQGFDNTPGGEWQRPLLSDILTIQNSASIFYSYARETDTGKLLSKENSRITVFAPTNKAVMALARKP